MKAVRLTEPGKALELHEIPIPSFGALDVLVRVKAAGICHSDAHYRAGISPVRPLPMTLGHEVAGVVVKAGAEVRHLRDGDRVCIHYMATCGCCNYCNMGSEQFCPSGKMIGKSRDGGYAEHIVVPGRSAFLLPQQLSFEQAAVMMCSSATSLHALNKARLKVGESVAIFGVGGLGMSAVQLAKALGAQTIFAVDIRPNKLEMAAAFGAVPVFAGKNDPVAEIRKATGGRGVDVAMELVGLPITMKQSVASLAVFGRAVMAGISDRSFEVSPYDELINREAEIIGVSDHLASEIPQLLHWAVTGQLDLSRAITRRVGLDAAEINGVLDDLDSFSRDVRAVIMP